MPYCTLQNLIDRFGDAELKQLTGGGAAIDEVVINRAIDDAEAEINSYLLAYALPLAAVPANFELIACDLVRFYLYKTKVPEVVDTRYKKAIRYLEKVSEGKVKLQPDTAGTVPAVTDSLDFVAQPAVFGNLNGY
jgi:phage gp36-like protein